VVARDRWNLAPASRPKWHTIASGICQNEQRANRSARKFWFKEFAAVPADRITLIASDRLAAEISDLKQWRDPNHYGNAGLF